MRKTSRRFSASWRLLLLLAATTFPVVGHGQAAAPPRTITDLLPLFEQYQPDQKLQEKSREEIKQVPPQDAGQSDLARFYLKRGLSAMDIGEYQQAALDLTKAFELGGSQERIRALARLGWVQLVAGDLQIASDTIRKAIDQIPSWHGARVDLLGLSAYIAARSGKFEMVGPAIKELNDVVNWNRGLRSWRGFEHSFLERQNRWNGLVLKEQGKLAEAEVALREAIRQGELDAPINRQRLAWGWSTYSAEEHAMFLDWSRASLADVLARQGRTLEAELALREGLKGTLSRNDPVGRAAYILSLSLETIVSLGRPAEAEAMAKAGLRMLSRTEARPDYILLILRRVLADALAEQQRHAEAVTAFRAIFEAVKQQSERVVAAAGRGTPEIGLALGRSGHATEGLAMLDEQYASSVKWRGKEHYMTAQILGYRGIVRSETGGGAAGLADLRSAVELLMARQDDAYEDQSPRDRRRFNLILDAYLAALSEATAAPPPGLDPVAEAFRLADALRSRKIQAALTASAVRSAADTSELAALIRKLQDLGGEEDALMKILYNMTMLPPEKQLPKVMADMRKRLDAIKPERNILANEVRERFPAYADLVRPRSATIADIQATLRPGESFLSVLPTMKRTLVWAIPKEGKPAFAAVPLSGEAIDRMVLRLRKALDVGDIQLDKMPEFDLATAHRLYQELLAPVAAGWQGAEHLFVSAGGSLSQLPFAVLPTAPASLVRNKQKFAEYRKVQWLVRKLAITQLPSGSALITLRQMKPGNSGRSSFVGFGDPNFGVAEGTKVAMTRQRNLAVTRAIGKDIEEQGKVDWIEYRQLPPLPDTREEILAVAEVLGADARKDVFLGERASKQNLRSVDLAQKRIVAFATHGLLPGDFPGLDQPALALASTGSAEEGLLRLDEILRLKLDADWVLLSACNTAAGDGEGAEALSGLGRGFFYAGARALLATHWPVETVSAKELVKGIFLRYADGARLTRAESLRRAMLALIDEVAAPNHAYAHPMYWAPYAVIGDGGTH